MLNIFFLPSQSEEKFNENFKNHLEGCFKELPPEVVDSVFLYVVENYRTYFPDAINEKPCFTFFQKERYPEGIQEKVDLFIRAVQGVSDLWTRHNGFLSSINGRIYVFFKFESKEQIENQYFNKKSDSGDTPSLNVMPIEPIHRFDRMVLNEEVRKELDSCVTMIVNLDKIYDEWGFSEVDPVKKSVLNFYGPPGTGKTMAAHAISAQLGKKILAINYSDVESKFVGDAPKNLVSVFDIAKKENCVLFFDEADSFLGKRVTNVSSSSDQAVNSLRSQMLILLESFSGTVIFATNLNENYDKAFMSRIISSIKFELPDKNLRKQAIRGMIPAKAPMDSSVLTEELLDELADLCDGFSHREIKNVALAILTECCSRGTDIDAELLREIFQQKKVTFEEQRASLKDKGKAMGSTIAQNLKSGNFSVVGKTTQVVEWKENPGYEHLSSKFLSKQDDKQEGGLK